jgi:hypothetical protein
MKSLDNIAEDLFNKIRGRFPSVTIGDADGKVTNDPLVARFFDFDYKEGDRNIGKVSISVSEDKLAVMYSNSFVEDEDTITRQNWYNFLKELRVFAKKRLLQFDTRDITKSNLDKRDYKFLAQQQGGEQTMSESKMYGTSKMSYQNIGNARLSIKHTESVNQELASGRTQKIGAIYVENADGERFKYPYKHLNGARAMARHVSEGGRPYDDFGKHITGLSEELANLRKFKTYMNRSSVMAESLAGYMDAVVERLDTIKKTVAGLQKESYYKQAVESYEVPVMEDVPADVAENWIDELTIRQFNEDLKDVFPFVYKLVGEATRAKEVGPDDLAEGPIDWVKDKYADFKQGQADRMQKYEGELELMRKIMADNGMDRSEIAEIESGCLNDPRVCMYNHIRKSGFGHKHHNELQDIYQDLKGGLTTRSGTTDEDFEEAIDELMGQFAEGVCEDCGNPSWTTLGMTEEEIEEGERHGNSKIYDKCWKGYRKVPGKKAGEEGSCKKVESEDGELKEPQIPVTEFILSLFDRENGQFPKGETAVLTAIEKDYGEQFIEPAKAFIEQVNQTYASFKEGNAYAHAVRKAKMNGAKKGDEIDGPDDEKITIEKDDLLKLAGL